MSANLYNIEEFRRRRTGRQLVPSQVEPNAKLLSPAARRLFPHVQPANSFEATLLNQYATAKSRKAQLYTALNRLMCPKCGQFDRRNLPEMLFLIDCINWSLDEMRRILDLFAKTIRQRQHTSAPNRFSLVPPLQWPGSKEAK